MDACPGSVSRRVLSAPEPVQQAASWGDMCRDARAREAAGACDRKLRGSHLMSMRPLEGAKLFMQMIVEEGLAPLPDSDADFIPLNPPRFSASRGTWIGVCKQ
jgi:hypothetical protein